MYTLGAYFQGTTTLESLFSVTVGASVDAVGFLLDAFFEEDPLTQAALLVLVGAAAFISLVELFGSSLTAGAVTLAKYLAYSIPWIAFLLGVGGDIIDSDGIIG